MVSHRSFIDQNRDAYDKIAPRFAEINAAMPGELKEQAGRLIARLPAAPARILDLDCGAGRDIAWFEALEQQMFGADLSRGMLNQARLVTRAPLIQMDMRFLGFVPSIFQAVWCCAALLHLPKNQAPAALLEISRVLVPGGFLSLSVQKGAGEGLERCMYDRPIEYGGEIERFFARYEQSEMAALLEEAGFTILQQGENTGSRLWLWYDACKAK
jgi:ubiquinone/menaquinone biosynthesis C-methylase UbiE